MKFTETNQGGKTTINFDYYDKETGGGGTVIFTNAYNNCKLGVIEYCNGIFMGTEEQMKARFDLILSRLAIAVSLNTPYKNVVDFIRNNYEVYSCAEVPIGYVQDGGFQYHIIIRNTLTKASNTQYQRPIPKGDPDKVKLVEGFLKKRRRKADIANELVKLLQETINT